MAEVAERFEDQIAETQSGGNAVDDFVRKTLFAFQWADMLVPAPMAVAILGQLTLVATATDFKLVKPAGGLKFVKYPESFRATIIQLVNTCTLALNQSYANFNEINKRCAAIKPGVNNIVQLLVGDEDNTQQENDDAVRRHLPSQIRRLSGTVNACLTKARETDTVFHNLLELTMEIHESCTATQGENEAQVQDACLRKTILDNQKMAAEQMKRHSAEEAQTSREEFQRARASFDKAVDSMPSGMELIGLQAAEAFLQPIKALGQIMTLNVINRSASANAAQNRAINSASRDSNAPSRQTPVTNPFDISDPGYQKAALLRAHAVSLQALLTSGKDGGFDWDDVKSKNKSKCAFVRVNLDLLWEEMSKRVSKGKGGEATLKVMNLSARGVKYAREFENFGLTPDKDAQEKLVQSISAWVTDVMAFATDADLKLGTNLVDNKGFMNPDHSLPAFDSPSVTEMRVQSAQYSLSVTEAQLDAARENVRKTSDKFLEVTANLGEIMAQIAGLDVQRVQWDKITAILLRAISFLCALKGCLNDLVHFFDALNNLVSVPLQDAAAQFIQIIKDATEPAQGIVASKTLGGITLDRWARQAIYHHAISAAKVGRLVENITDMYVTLYNGNIHPGVNKVLEMGKLVGSGEQAAIARAGTDIQFWADGACIGIKDIVNQRLKDYESDIQSRTEELGRSLGGILPPSRQLGASVSAIKESYVGEVCKAIDIAADEKPVYKRLGKLSV